MNLILLTRVLARQAGGCRGTARLMTALAVAAGIGCVLVTDDDGFCCCIYRLLIPQVRLARKYPISPWEMIHPPGGDNPVRI
jgi:hypothetical protein